MLSVVFGMLAIELFTDPSIIAVWVAVVTCMVLTVQDDNGRLSETLTATRTDLTAQLAQCEQVCTCMYMYRNYVHAIRMTLILSKYWLSRVLRSFSTHLHHTHTHTHRRWPDAARS